MPNEPTPTTSESAEPPAPPEGPVEPKRLSRTATRAVVLSVLILPTAITAALVYYRLERKRVNEHGRGDIVAAISIPVSAETSGAPTGANHGSVVVVLERVDHHPFGFKSQDLRLSSLDSRDGKLIGRLKADQPITFEGHTKTRLWASRPSGALQAYDPRSLAIVVTPAKAIAKIPGGETSVVAMRFDQRLRGFLVRTTDGKVRLVDGESLEVIREENPAPAATATASGPASMNVRPMCRGLPEVPAGRRRGLALNGGKLLENVLNEGSDIPVATVLAPADTYTDGSFLAQEIMPKDGKNHCMGTSFENPPSYLVRYADPANKPALARVSVEGVRVWSRSDVSAIEASPSGIVVMFGSFGSSTAHLERLATDDGHTVWSYP